MARAYGSTPAPSCSSSSCSGSCGRSRATLAASRPGPDRPRVPPGGGAPRPSTSVSLSRLSALDLVHRAVRQRHDVEVAVRPGLHVGSDAEVASEQQALALGDLPLVQVVGDAVLEPRVVDADLAPVAAQV